MNRVSTFLIGLIAGIIVTAIAVWTIMPTMMIKVYDSRYDFDTTVSTLEQSIKETGTWQLPKVYDIQQSFIKAGYTDMERVKIMSLCQPHHAYEILKKDENKFVTAIMPCRFSVFERKDGSVGIAGMNVGLMSQMFGGDIARVMAGVAEEEHKMLEKVIK